MVEMERGQHGGPAGADCFEFVGGHSFSFARRALMASCWSISARVDDAR
jgi:hypothetical protein